MAINKVDINLTTALNEDNIDGTYGSFIPKNRYVEFSDYLSQNLNTYEKTVGVKNPRCKVVKLIDTTSNSAQVASYSWTRTNTQELSTNNMRIIQAKVICPNGPRGVVPYPSDVANPSVENQDPFINSLHTTAFLEFDSTKNQIQLAVLDEVIIEYVGNDRSEAKILEVFRINNRTAQSNEPNPQTAFNNSDGTTIGDTRANTTGDVTEPKAQKDVNQKPTGKCGGLVGFPEEDCKTEKLTATGQIITLHPKFWKTIDDLLIEIKDKENKEIRIASAYRTGDEQYEIRKTYCPAALIEKDGYNTVGSKKVPGRVGGERWLKRTRWSDVLGNFQCKNQTSAAAAEGPYASNHTKGLAVDFRLEVPCAAKNKNPTLYDKCLGTDPIYKLINKYASKYGIKNLVGDLAEVWHWSPNGR